MSRIYYVEDDEDIRNLVVYTLNMTGFEARGFESAPSFRRALELETPDLILLDVMLPGESGLDILRALKAQPETMRIPVMMITARSAEEEKVNGLEYGADDYIAKPFGVMELVARVKAVLRRCAAPEHGDVLRCGEIQLDTGEHSVHVGEDEVHLTLKEFTLLCLLMENHGRLMERERLIQRVWGSGCADATHTLDAHMRTLRAKLGAGGNRIQTVYGRGYRLRDGE